MKKKKSVNVKLLKGEKTMYIIIIILVILIPLSSVITNALLSESNILVEELNYKISSQESINESLTMQINELASLQNIQEIASLYNLVYNNDNIKDIKEK